MHTYIRNLPRIIDLSTIFHHHRRSKANMFDYLSFPPTHFISIHRRDHTTPIGPHHLLFTTRPRLLTKVQRTVATSSGRNTQASMANTHSRQLATTSSCPSSPSCSHCKSDPSNSERPSAPSQQTSLLILPLKL